MSGPTTEKQCCKNCNVNKRMKVDKKYLSNLIVLDSTSVHKKLPGCPRRFTGHFRAQKESQAPKNQNFQEIKNMTFGTGPCYKCTKFQKYLTTNDFTIALRRFTGHY